MATTKRTKITIFKYFATQLFIKREVNYFYTRSYTPNSTFNTEDMEASTNHTKLTIGTKTKHLKKLKQIANNNTDA